MAKGQLKTLAMSLDGSNANSTASKLIVASGSDSKGSKLKADFDSDCGWNARPPKMKGGGQVEDGEGEE